MGRWHVTPPNAYCKIEYSSTKKKNLVNFFSFAWLISIFDWTCLHDFLLFDSNITNYSRLKMFTLIHCNEIIFFFHWFFLIRNYIFFYCVIFLTTENNLIIVLYDYLNFLLFFLWWKLDKSIDFFIK